MNLTNAEKRQLLLDVADHIEREPRLYNFMSVELPADPNHCGSPACILGWMAAYLYIRHGRPVNATDSVVSIAFVAFGMSDLAFYNAMSDISRHNEDWLNRASDTVEVLRRFADERFPATA